MARPVVVIMGAAVDRDGRPGAAVVRRTRAALRFGEQRPDTLYLPTGGARGGGPIEADVMARLLVDGGVHAEAIIVDDRAQDTLQSVVNCTDIIRRLGASCVVVCTDRYHLPRCRVLFRLAGVVTHAAPIPADLDTVGSLPRGFYWLRELIALPFDTLLLLCRQLRARWLTGAKN